MTIPSIVKQSEILIVSSVTPTWINLLTPDAYNVHPVDNPQQALERLQEHGFDIVMIHDKVESENIADYVREMKRRAPLVPVIILSDEADVAYQTDLMEAGADDVLDFELNGEELARRLRLILRQRRQNITLAHRNHNLHLITMVSRRLHSAPTQQSFVHDAFDILCSTLQLYGAAVVVNEENVLKLYALRTGSGDDRFYEGPIHLQEYDPFQRVMEGGVIQLYVDVNLDQFYLPPPPLQNASSAIFVPLNYQDDIVGTLAVFGTTSKPLDQEDVALYELFADQFAIAFNNIITYGTQNRRAQINQLLLRAWQRFVNLQTPQEIAEALRELVEDVPDINRALVMLYGDTEDNTDEMIVSAHTKDMSSIFQDLYSNGYFREVFKQFDQSLEPVIISSGRVQDAVLRQLFTQMNGHYIVFLPIVDSARIVGVQVASTADNRPLTNDNFNLVKSLAHTAGQALERMTLMHIMLEKSARLEAILRSVSEGIFFVDETDKVIFCNPQFTELTGINPSEVIYQDSKTLLERLARRSTDYDQVMAQLRAAITSLPAAADYPIVEISLTLPKRDIHIELVAIETLDSGINWSGVVRDNSRFKDMFSNQLPLLGTMPEHIRVHYAQVRGLITTLVEQHNNFAPRERHFLLRKVERSIERVGMLWDNFSELYKLEITGLILDREHIDPYDLVQSVLDYRYFSRVRRRIDVNAPDRIPNINIDAFHMTRAVANILQFIVEEAPQETKVAVTIERQGHNVLLLLSNTNTAITQSQVDQIFSVDFKGNGTTSGTTDGTIENENSLGIYLSHEIIRKHGGTMDADATAQGVLVTIGIPAIMTDEFLLETEPIADTSSTVREAASGLAARAPERTLKRIMVVRGHSKLSARSLTVLQNKGFEVLDYDDPEEAFSDLKSARMDLILLDTQITNEDSLKLCERIRKRTTSPVILIADEFNRSDKVLGLNMGADGYINEPISEDELIAEVKTLFKREQIVERVSEPLEFGALYIDLARREVFYNNKPVELTRIEYDLLRVLAINEGQVLSHEQLLTQVWGPEYRNETHYLWVNVSRLRKKIEPTNDSPRYIHNQPGIGYMFRQP